MDGITDNGHELEQTPVDSERQGNLACCSSWGHKDSDTTQQQNNNNNNYLCKTLAWYSGPGFTCEKCLC